MRTHTKVIVAAVFVVFSAAGAAANLNLGDNATLDNALVRRAQADQLLYREERIKAKYFADKTAEQVKKLLGTEDFVSLENSLEQLDANFFKDPAYEPANRDVLYALASCGPADEKQAKEMDDWVRIRPKSAWAHLIRGMYFIGLACNARGEEWADKVAESQWKMMDGYLNSAILELHSASSLNRKLAPVYWSLIDAFKLEGNLAAAEDAMHQGHNMIPTSYLVPAYYMLALEPRWEGSYAQMQSFAAQMVQDVDKNPRFWDLQGYAEGDTGDIAYDAQDYKTAFAHYKEALRYGDFRHWLIFAGESARMLGNTAVALEYYRRNEIYEIPLSERHAKVEGELISRCISLQPVCKADPSEYPWYREPNLSQ